MFRELEPAPSDLLDVPETFRDPDAWLEYAAVAIVYVPLSDERRARGC